jgi:PqqD family protein of HPr-rel-A system
MVTNSTVPTDCKWRAADGDDLVWAEWGGDYVVFHRPSGKTHLLNDVGRHLLTQVLTEPRATEEVARILLDADGGYPDAEFVADVEGMLERYDQLGLVDRT